MPPRSRASHAVAPRVTDPIVDCNLHVSMDIKDLTSLDLRRDLLKQRAAKIKKSLSGVRVGEFVRAEDPVRELHGFCKRQICGVLRQASLDSQFLAVALSNLPPDARAKLLGRKVAIYDEHMSLPAVQFSGMFADDARAKCHAAMRDTARQIFRQDLTPADAARLVSDPDFVRLDDAYGNQESTLFGRIGAILSGLADSFGFRMDLLSDHGVTEAEADSTVAPQLVALQSRREALERELHTARESRKAERMAVDADMKRLESELSISAKRYVHLLETTLGSARAKHKTEVATMEKRIDKQERAFEESLFNNIYESFSAEYDAATLMAQSRLASSGGKGGEEKALLLNSGRQYLSVEVPVAQRKGDKVGASGASVATSTILVPVTVTAVKPAVSSPQNNTDDDPLPPDDAEAAAMAASYQQYSAEEQEDIARALEVLESMQMDGEHPPVAGYQPSEASSINVKGGRDRDITLDRVTVEKNRQGAGQGGTRGARSTGGASSGPAYMKGTKSSVVKVKAQSSAPSGVVRKGGTGGGQSKAVHGQMKALADAIGVDLSPEELLSILDEAKKESGAPSGGSGGIDVRGVTSTVGPSSASQHISPPLAVEDLAQQSHNAAIPSTRNRASARSVSGHASVNDGDSTTTKARNILDRRIATRKNKAKVSAAAAAAALLSASGRRKQGRADTASSPDGVPAYMKSTKSALLKRQSQVRSPPDHPEFDSQYTFIPSTQGPINDTDGDNAMEEDAGSDEEGSDDNNDQTIVQLLVPPQYPESRAATSGMDLPDDRGPGSNSFVDSNNTPSPANSLKRRARGSLLAMSEQRSTDYVSQSPNRVLDSVMGAERLLSGSVAQSRRFDSATSHSTVLEYGIQRSGSDDGIDSYWTAQLTRMAEDGEREASAALIQSRYRHHLRRRKDGSGQAQLQTGSWPIERGQSLLDSDDDEGDGRVGETRSAMAAAAAELGMSIGPEDEPDAADASRTSSRHLSLLPASGRNSTIAGKNDSGRLRGNNSLVGFNPPMNVAVPPPPPYQMYDDDDVGDDDDDEEEEEEEEEEKEEEEEEEGDHLSPLHSSMMAPRISQLPAAPRISPLPAAPRTSRVVQQGGASNTNNSEPPPPPYTEIDDDDDDDDDDDGFDPHPSSMHHQHNGVAGNHVSHVDVIEPRESLLIRNRQQASLLSQQSVSIEKLQEEVHRLQSGLPVTSSSPSSSSSLVVQDKDGKDFCTPVFVLPSATLLPADFESAVAACEPLTVQVVADPSDPDEIRVDFKTALVEGCGVIFHMRLQWDVDAALEPPSPGRYMIKSTDARVGGRVCITQDGSPSKWTFANPSIATAKQQTEIVQQQQQGGAEAALTAGFSSLSQLQGAFDGISGRHSEQQEALDALQSQSSALSKSLSHAAQYGPHSPVLAARQELLLSMAGTLVDVKSKCEVNDKHVRTLEQNYERLTLANWQISRAMEQAEQEKAIRPPSSAANANSESDMREQMRMSALREAQEMSSQLKRMEALSLKISQTV